jgi:3-oxoacyl-[acyl-carrier protein] reductase
VKSFLEEGAIVHFCSRTEADVIASQDRLSKTYPGKAIGTTVDVSKPTSLTAWVSDCAKQSGSIDVIVANVSAIATKDTPEMWQNAFSTDITSTVTLVNAALPHLIASTGNIITISSVSSRIIDFTANPSPYGAFKAALIHYTSQVAHKYAEKGVRANTISPGNIYIEDGIFGEIEREMPEFFQRQKEANPLGRMGKAEEVADVAVFVGSARAGFMTGSNVLVDGGLSQGVQF